MKHLSPILMVVFLLGVGVVGTCHAGNKKYLSKTVIDTLIQQAFVNLNATSDGMPGSDIRHLLAINDAKRVFARLRETGRGDPNEKYILWKTGELESQILLEERDIILQQLEKRQKEKNAIIAIFNAELGKKRPEFAVLSKAIDKMTFVDPSKTGEMGRSFDQRRSNISRAVIAALEKALRAGDWVTMQPEFDYCKKNREYLTITPSAYARFETRMLAQSEAIKQKPAIDEQLARVENLLQRNKFGDVWTCLAEVEGRLSRCEGDLPPKSREAYEAAVKKWIETTNRKEDSLVEIPYSMCAKNGENAALDYIERVLKPMKISETKLGQTTTSILRIAASRKKEEDTVLGARLRELSQQQGSGIDFSEVRLAAKKKAQERADSVRAIEEEKTRQLYRDQARSDSIRQAAQHQAQQALRADQEKANEIAAQIYTMLEENKIEDAYKKFLSVQKALEKYLLKDAFALLKTTVLQAYLAFTRDTIAIKGTNGVAIVEKSQYDTLFAGRQSSPQDLRRNQEKAQRVIVQIYGLLEANNVDAAYKRFCDVRAPLQKYLCTEAFAMLETTVLQSYESRRGRTGK